MAAIMNTDESGLTFGVQDARQDPRLSRSLCAIQEKGERGGR